MLKIISKCTTGKIKSIFTCSILSDGTIRNFPDSITVSDFLNRTVMNHQNTLIKSSLFFEHGFYNEELQMKSDYEFFLKELWKYRSIFAHVKTNIAVYDVNGISSQNSPERSAEHIIALRNIFQELAEFIIEPYYGKRKLSSNDLLQYY